VQANRRGSDRARIRRTGGGTRVGGRGRGIGARGEGGERGIRDARRTVLARDSKGGKEE